MSDDLLGRHHQCEFCDHYGDDVAYIENPGVLGFDSGDDKFWVCPKCKDELRALSIEEGA